MLYGNLTDFRAYALARGDSAPTDAADPVATAALQRAADYIRTRYVIRMALDAPEVDPAVLEATYIAARREVATPGFWAKTFTPSEVKTLVQVDAIRWQPATISIGLTGRDLVTPMDPAIDALLRPLGNMPVALTV
jgi:hypothetical protein